MSRVANGLSVRAGGKVANAKVLYSALEAAWEHLYSSHNSVAFGCGLIPSKEAFPSHTEEARYSRVSGEGVPAVFSQRQQSQWELQARRRRWAGVFAAGCSSGR